MSELPAWFFPVLAANVGLVVGSFLNVVIHRLPRGESLSHPPSRCPRCGAAIRWYDNVPVLSYLFLAGRCRDCRAPISPRYPLVEAATGLLFFAAALKLPQWLWVFHAVVLGSLCLALALIDLEHMILPDALTLPGVALGLLFAWLGGPTPLLPAIIGTVLGAALPLSIIWAYRWLRGVEGMGLGDVKLLAMLGAFLGWQGMLLTLALGAVAGALVGVGLILLGKGSRQTELPFGTFLCAAAVVVLFLGEKLLTFWSWSQP
jgi:leader peptidase (prepilin peptidase)/N-methyltransferase